MTPRLVIYGDFNCPYSAVASDRALELEHTGLATVDWRAVEHERSVPAAGEPVEGDLRAHLEEEVSKIRSAPGTRGRVDLVLPRVKVNTAGLVAAYAALPEHRRPGARRALFHAYWHDGDPAATAATAGAVLPTRTNPRRAAQWQREWCDLGESIVPALVEAGRDTVYGLDAIERLESVLLSSSSRA